MTIQTRHLDLTIEGAITNRISPIVAAAIGTLDDIRPQYVHVHGAIPSTLFDLASLTKVFSTTLVAAHAIELGKLSLQERPFLQWPSVRVIDLLQHTSGLPAWKNLYSQSATRRCLAQKALQTPLSHATNSRTTYSDIGFIALGSLLESRLKKRVDVVFQNLSRRYYNSETISYRPIDQSVESTNPIAPTGFCSVRRRQLQGEVNDLNAFGMDGVAPHAGLFATVDDVAKVAHFFLSSIKSPKTSMARILYDFSLAQGERSIGFDRASKDGSTGGVLSVRALGHLGHTGTSVWIDPLAANGRGAYFVLLTNHLEFSSRKAEIKQFRQEFHSAAIRWINSM